MNNININILVRIYLFLNKGLINVYTIKLIKYKNDRRQGIVSNNSGIFITLSFSLFVQLDSFDILS